MQDKVTNFTLRREKLNKNIESLQLKVENDLRDQKDIILEKITMQR